MLHRAVRWRGKEGVTVWKRGAEGERKVGCDGAEKRVRCGREGRRVRKKWGAMAWKRGVESVGRWTGHYFSQSPTDTVYAPMQPYPPRILVYVE